MLYSLCGNQHCSSTYCVHQTDAVEITGDRVRVALHIQYNTGEWNSKSTARS